MSLGGGSGTSPAQEAYACVVSVGELAALFVACATLLSSISGLVIALRNDGRLATVHRLVNGQSQQLLSLTHSTAFKAGQAYGRRASDEA